ncbi:hypothetical protein MBLNU459_g7182t1 [Dothideomycetes sp. NU459]
MDWPSPMDWTELGLAFLAPRWGRRSGRDVDWLALLRARAGPPDPHFGSGSGVGAGVGAGFGFLDADALSDTATSAFSSIHEREYLATPEPPAPSSNHRSPPYRAMAWQPGAAFSPSLHHPGTQSPAAHAPADQQHAFPTALQQGQTTPLSAPAAAASRKRKKSESQHAPSPDGDEQQQQQQQPSSASKPHPVKRACNQCRQQKLKCNIITEPEFQACNRCVKHNLPCAIDPGFRRQEKRQRHAQMERELDVLKHENAQLKMNLAAAGMAPSAQMQSAFNPQPPFAAAAAAAAAAATASPAAAPSSGVPNPHFPGPNEAAAGRSLLDLAQGYDGSHVAAREPTPTTLGRVVLSEDETQELIAIFFARYHPYLPLLSPDQPFSAFFKLHPLVHWAIVTIASRRYATRPGLLQELAQPLTDLLWSTIASVPQTYHVVKALCLICTWPLPTSSTSSDPSMLICGTMVQLAMQFGLHRPSHAQDFSRNRIELREEDIQDRMNTWVACNLVAQNISTGYGMPQLSRWNWFTHGLHLDRVSPAFRNRCQIERFVDRVTRSLYTMQRDQVIESDDAQRSLMIDTIGREYEEINTTIRTTNPNPIDILHLHIAALHLRLTVFFDSPASPTYRSELSNLFIAASTLLKTFLALPPDVGLTDANLGAASDAPASPFATNYIMQMILAAGFTLLKLLNSYFAAHIDGVQGKNLFLSTVIALRAISVQHNDLPQRLAEVLAQLWQASGGGSQRFFEDQAIKKEPDSSLTLKVRCRMSMSLLYDMVWKYRDQMGASASKNLDRAVVNPTIPAVGHEGGDALPSTMTNDYDLGPLGANEPWNMDFPNVPFDTIGYLLDDLISGDAFNFN